MGEKKQETEWIVSCQEFEVNVGMHKGSVLSAVFFLFFFQFLFIVAEEFAVVVDVDTELAKEGVLDELHDEQDN